MMNWVILLLLLPFISVPLLLLFELFLCSRHVAATAPPTAVNDDVVDYDIMPMNMMLHTLYLLITLTNCYYIKISLCGVIPADDDGLGTPSSSFYIHPVAATIFRLVGSLVGFLVGPILLFVICCFYICNGHRHCHHPLSLLLLLMLLLLFLRLLFIPMLLIMKINMFRCRLLILCCIQKSIVVISTSSIDISNSPLLTAS